MIVIKVGGSLGVNIAAICTDIAALTREGIRIIVVHGGSHEANMLGNELGHIPRFLTSVSGVQSRYTDAATLDVLTMAMVGRVKPSIVTQLLAFGVNAVGLTGLDGSLIQAKRKSALKAIVDGYTQIIRDDLSGNILHINTHLLDVLLQGGYVPVISPPAHDKMVGSLNVDADRAAASIASAMSAEKLIILSNVPGILHDVNDMQSIVERVPSSQFESSLALARGRMKLKLIAAREALRGGVQQVILGDGRISFPVRQALAEKGTILYVDERIERITI